MMDEFFAQGDRERALGVAPSPGFDRETTSIPGSQINFMDFIVFPILASLVRIFPASYD